MDIPLINKLAENGLLALLLAIFIFVAWAEFKIIQDISEKRINDLKEIGDTLSEPIKQIKTNGELLLALFQKFLSDHK